MHIFTKMKKPTEITSIIEMETELLERSCLVDEMYEKMIGDYGQQDVNEVGDNSELFEQAKKNYESLRDFAKDNDYDSALIRQLNESYHRDYLEEKSCKDLK